MTPQIFQTAAQFAEDVSSVNSIAELEHLYVTSLYPHGVEFYVCGQLIFPGGVMKTVRFFDAVHHPWFQYYMKKHLFLDDPTPRIAQQTAHAFTWSWVLENFKLSPAENWVFDQARRFGLADGVIVPVHGPHGTLAGMSISGPDIKTGPVEVAGFDIIMRTAYAKALEILGLDAQIRSLPLSNRQRDCLNWAQHGKSNREIALILGISEHTVKEHMNAAKKALGVSSRIEAVIVARGANLIGNNPLSNRQKKLD